MQRSRRMMMTRLAAILAVLLLFVAVAQAASPSEDRILGLDRYTSDKGGTLAATYGATFKQTNTSIYNRMPWLEVQKEELGASKPPELAGANRALCLRVQLEH